MKFLLAALFCAWSFSTHAFTITGDCSVASSVAANVNVTVFPCVALNVVPVSPPLMLHFTVFPVKLAFSAGTAVNITFPPFANGYAPPTVCSVPALILAILTVLLGGFDVIVIVFVFLTSGVTATPSFLSVAVTTTSPAVTPVNVICVFLSLPKVVVFVSGSVAFTLFTLQSTL